MGIDWIVDFGCPAKEALGTESILHMLKARSRAATIIESARSRGDERPPDELEFEMVLLGPDGPQQRRLSAGSLLAQAAPLDVHANGCEGCPANVGARPYGCVGYISYPITAASERWLLGRLPREPDSTAGAFLRRALTDFGWDGAGTRRMRERPEIFEAREPLERRWADGAAVTTDQLFEMLFGLGPLQPAHTMMICLFLGLLPEDLPPAVLGQLGRGEGQLLRLAETLRDDAGARLRRDAPGPGAVAPQEEALFRFLIGAMVAAGLSVATLIDA